MGKATLEFNLPDEYEEFMMAAKGRNMMNVLSELDQDLRAKTKYAPDTTSKEVYDALSQVRETLREFMFNNDITFNL
jgi:hypothetical protein